MLCKAKGRSKVCPPSCRDPQRKGREAHRWPGLQPVSQLRQNPPSCTSSFLPVLPSPLFFFLLLLPPLPSPSPLLPPLPPPFVLLSLPPSSPTFPSSPAPTSCCASLTRNTSRTEVSKAPHGLCRPRCSAVFWRRSFWELFTRKEGRAGPGPEPCPAGSVSARERFPPHTLRPGDSWPGDPGPALCQDLHQPQLGASCIATVQPSLVTFIPALFSPRGESRSVFTTCQLLCWRLGAEPYMRPISWPCILVMGR